jgi:diamine N-acetyltransferase
MRGIPDERSLQAFSASTLRALREERWQLLYRADGNDDLVAANEPVPESAEPAPILYACRSVLGLSLRFRAGVPEEVRRAAASRLERCRADEEAGPALAGLARELWPGAAPDGGPAFVVPDTGVPSGVAVEATEANRYALEPHFPFTCGHLEAYSPCAAVIVDGAAVSLCATVRRTKLAAEAGVRTVEAHRGKGLAPAAVALWARMTRSRGLVPCYSTGWTNAGSLAVARKLGMEWFAEDLCLLDPAPAANAGTVPAEEGRVRRLAGPGDLAACAAVLRASFATVAAEFGLTEENAPTNAAFATLENLQAHVSDGMELYGLFDDLALIGCVAVKRAKRDDGAWYVERLAVLPERRHAGHGARLLLFALDRIRERGGSTACIGLIDDNARLKAWYLSKGFVQHDRRRVAGLPFTVCFMSLRVK